MPPDARAARRRSLPPRAGASRRRGASRAREDAPSLRAALGGAAACHRERAQGHGRPACRQADRPCARGRSLSRDPSDDRRASALESAGCARRRQAGAGRIRARERNARADRGRHQAPGGDPPRAGRAVAGRARCRWDRRVRRRPRGVPGRAREREPHAQARADRSTAAERHRQRLLRRDPAPRPTLAREADATARRGGVDAPLRCDTRRAHRVGRAPAPGGR